mmetsp:Transcript_76859/g.159914  ORF Transcript_76859/g.159914 Transcript_76859/m.159914 type:complete len:213 (-) Transcript_76859:598-1236(-)
MVHRRGRLEMLVLERRPAEWGLAAPKTPSILRLSMRLYRSMHFRVCFPIFLVAPLRTGRCPFVSGSKFRAFAMRRPGTPVPPWPKLHHHRQHSCSSLASSSSSPNWSSTSRPSGGSRSNPWKLGRGPGTDSGSPGSDFGTLSGILQPEISWELRQVGARGRRFLGVPGRPACRSAACVRRRFHKTILRRRAGSLRARCSKTSDFGVATSCRQ